LAEGSGTGGARGGIRSSWVGVAAGKGSSVSRRWRRRINGVGVRDLEEKPKPEGAAEIKDVLIFQEKVATSSRSGGGTKTSGGASEKGPGNPKKNNHPKKKKTKKKTGTFFWGLSELSVRWAPVGGNS